MKALEKEIDNVKEMIGILKAYKYDCKNASIKESIIDIENRMIQKNLSSDDVKYIIDRINLIGLSIGA